MSVKGFEIICCPPELISDAVALALSDIAPGQRREILLQSKLGRPASGAAIEGLMVAMCDGRLCGAAWGQRQPGNTAVFWPPQLTGDAATEVAPELTHALVEALDDLDVGLMQVLLTDRTAAIVPVLEAGGFQYLANLLYLTWETTSVVGQLTAPLEFEPYDETFRGRLAELLERTYEDTRDCAAMNGKRTMQDVIDGYQGTGVYRPENWLIVLAEGHDVGVVLLTEHPAARHWELMYMGLVPAARGRNWGRAIVHQSQALASDAAADRIVLAVDAANLPALAMYRDAGFRAWDERAVFVRFGKRAQ